MWIRLLFMGVALGAMSSQDPDWVGDARRNGLDDKEIAHLRRHKVLIGARSYKQIFEPYIGRGLAPFITSDSLLKAFHVLYEESVVRVEERNARYLATWLRPIWDGLSTIDQRFKGRAELVQAAKKRSQIVLGTALTLLGEELKLEPPLADPIKGEVEKILAGRAKEKPAWLGPPDAGFLALDYSRYAPRGFYGRHQTLQKYFRAVRWLQSIPFRIDQDEELLAIRMMQHGTRDAELSLFETYRELLGSEDDWDLLHHRDHVDKQADLDERYLEDWREDLKKHVTVADEPKINDQLRFAPAEPINVAELSYRILSACRTPDGILFQRLRSAGGLDVAAALGSDIARSKLQPERAALVEKLRPLFQSSGFYGGYLKCLESLLDKPEPDAPEFMSKEIWKVKSCQTALAGWAQLRHTWSLQAKENVYYMGMTNQDAGFVEPEPEFFARMAEHVDKTASILRRAGAFDLNLPGLGSKIRTAATFLKERGFTEKGIRAEDELKEADRERLRSVDAWVSVFYVYGEISTRPQFYRRVVARMEEAAARLENGGWPDDRGIVLVLKSAEFDLDPLWNRLSALCRRLEALAHKQLRGVEFGDEEKKFLRDYGQDLAGIMLYGGNAYLVPRDDAPRIVDIFRDPQAGRSVHVGIGRPRILYVLYPTKSGEVLCQGAVSSYYEFEHPDRLIDSDWMGKLASQESPEWVRPALTQRPLLPPARKD